MPDLLVFVYYCQTEGKVVLFVLQWARGTLTVMKDWKRGSGVPICPVNVVVYRRCVCTGCGGLSCL